MKKTLLLFIAVVFFSVLYAKTIRSNHYQLVSKSEYRANLLFDLGRFFSANVKAGTRHRRADADTTKEVLANAGNLADSLKKPTPAGKLLAKSNRYDLYPNYFAALGGKRKSLLSSAGYKSAFLNADTGAVLYVPYTGATADVNLGAHSLTLPRIYGGIATTDTVRILPYATSIAKILGSDKGFSFTTSGPSYTNINATIQVSDLWLNQTTVKRGLFISSSQSNTTGATIAGTILAATNISIPATNTGNISNHNAYNMNITAASGATGTITWFGGNQISVSNAAAGLTTTNMFGQIIYLKNAGPNTNMFGQLISLINTGPNTNMTGLAIRGVSEAPAGKYSLYNDLALPSYTAANTLLGGLTDNGTDKLQITGGLLANGQAHYGAGRTLGALDFMYKQKADSTYAAKTDLVTFSTGLTDTANVITNDLSTGKAGGQNVYGGTAATDSLVLYPYTGSNLHFRVDQYGMVATNTTAPGVYPATFVSVNNWVDHNVLVKDLVINTQVAHTIAPRTANYIAFTSMAQIAANNTQNWTAPQSLIAANMLANITPGASGTITRSLGAYVLSQNASPAATVTYNTGAVINATGNATNTSVLTLGTTQITPVTGNWGIYNLAPNHSYLGANPILINTLTDNGIDKLQITGGLLANGQAHYAAGRTLGALDFMYKQKADSTYAAKTDLVTFSTGLTDTANVITNDLSTGKAGGQNIIGGTAATDSLILSPYVGATAKFRLDQNGMFFGNTARPVNFGSYASAYSWKDNNGGIRDVFINSQVSHTIAPRTTQYIGLTSWANVASTNTQNWNSNISGAIIGSYINSGAIGTFRNSYGALIESVNGSTTASVTYNTGAAILVNGNAVNTTILSLNINVLPIAGNWALYNSTGFHNYLGTGATLINTTTDNGIDKLQITGGLLTNGQAHYAAGRTLGALDFMYKQKADSAYAPLNTGGYVPYTGATNDVNMGAHSFISSGALTNAVNGTYASFQSNGIYNDPTGIVRDFYSSSSVAAITNAPSMNMRIVGGFFQPSIGSANIQNWPNAGAGVIGLIVAPNIQTGASGTIAKVVGIITNLLNASGTAIVNYWDVINSNIISNSGTISNSSFIHTNSIMPGTNTAFILQNWDNATAYPTGHWFLYNNTSNTNYLGTGATLINTTTDNGIDKLQVNGTIHTKGVKVDLNFPAPDYVFDADYKLASLAEVKKYIDDNHHLSEIPSAQQIEKNGLELGEMNAKLLKKIEELTLYLINKDKEDKQQQQVITQQQQQINELKKMVELLAVAVNKK